MGGVPATDREKDDASQQVQGANGYAKLDYHHGYSATASLPCPSMKDARTNYGQLGLTQVHKLAKHGQACACLAPAISMLISEGSPA